MAETQNPSGQNPADDLASQSALRAAKSAFDVHMAREGFTENTMKAFRSDLNIFTRFAGAWRRIGDISTADLERFTGWLAEHRDGPRWCTSP